MAEHNITGQYNQLEQYYATRLVQLPAAQHTPSAVDPSLSYLKFRSKYALISLCLPKFRALLQNFETFLLAFSVMLHK